MENQVVTILGGLIGGIGAIIAFEWRFTTHIKSDYVEPLLNPLIESIGRLEKSISKLEVVCENALKQISEMSTDMKLMEHKIKILDKRLDGVDERFELMARFCDHDHKGLSTALYSQMIQKSLPIQDDDGE